MWTELSFRHQSCPQGTYRHNFVVQLLSHVWLFVTPWTATLQASLSFTNPLSLLKLRSIEWVRDAIQPFHPLSFLSPLAFYLSQQQSLSSESVLCIRWPKYWSFSFSISPFNKYSGLISLGLTVFISFLSKGLSRVFSSITIWKHSFFSAQTSLQSNSHIHTWLLEKP